TGETGEEYDKNGIKFLETKYEEVIDSIEIVDSQGKPYGTTLLGDSATLKDYSGTITYNFTNAATTVELAVSFVPYTAQMSFTDSYLPLVETVHAGVTKDEKIWSEKVLMEPVKFTEISGSDTSVKEFDVQLPYNYNRNAALISSSQTVNSYLNSEEPYLSVGTFQGGGSGGEATRFRVTSGARNWSDYEPYALAAAGEEYWVYTVPKGIYVNSKLNTWNIVSAKEGDNDITEDLKVGYITKDKTVIILQQPKGDLVTIDGTGPMTFRMVGGEYYKSGNTASIVCEAFAKLYDPELNEQKYVYGTRTISMKLVTPEPSISVGNWDRDVIDWNYNQDFYTKYGKTYHLGGFTLGNRGLGDSSACDVTLTFDENINVVIMSVPGLYAGGTASNIKVTTSKGRTFEIPDLTKATNLNFADYMQEDEYPRTMEYHLNVIKAGQCWSWSSRPSQASLGYTIVNNGRCEGVLLNNAASAICTLKAVFEGKEGTVECWFRTDNGGNFRTNITASMDKGNNSYYPGNTINMKLAMSVPTESYINYKSCTIVNPVFYVRVPYLLEETNQRLFELDTSNITGKSSMGAATFTAVDKGTRSEGGITYKIYKIEADKEDPSDIAFEYSWCSSSNGQDNSASINLAWYIYNDNPCTQNW
ncbi:MAG: hypothetical protein HUJ76_11640, partial [Parasporobacterium sp.]|nr:hypothetical protein [Parasporobacterium sp.]